MRSCSRSARSWLASMARRRHRRCAFKRNRKRLCPPPYREARRLVCEALEPFGAFLALASGEAPRAYRSRAKRGPLRERAGAQPSAAQSATATSAAISGELGAWHWPARVA